jgi:hypothetical protein
MLDASSLKKQIEHNFFNKKTKLALIEAVDIVSRNRKNQTQETFKKAQKSIKSNLKFVPRFYKKDHPQREVYQGQMFDNISGMIKQLDKSLTPSMIQQGANKQPAQQATTAATTQTVAGQVKDALTQVAQDAVQETVPGSSGDDINGAVSQAVLAALRHPEVQQQVQKGQKQVQQGATVQQAAKQVLQQPVVQQAAVQAAQQATTSAVTQQIVADKVQNAITNSVTDAVAQEVPNAPTKDVDSAVSQAVLAALRHPEVQQQIQKGAKQVQKGSTVEQATKQVLKQPVVKQANKSALDKARQYVKYAALAAIHAKESAKQAREIANYFKSRI